MRKPAKERDIDMCLAKVPFEKGQWLRGITKVFLKDNEVWQNTQKNKKT
jgi:hypothetical protein